MARKRPLKKQPVGKTRVVFFFLFLLLALIVLVSVLSPPVDFMKATGAFLRDSVGLLVFFIPVFLFLTGSLILRLNFALKWLQRTAAVFVSFFFLTAMLSMILCRIKPDYLYSTGGLLSARVVLAAQGLVGGFVSWAGLFSLFIISIVIFTGWDIGSDINSLVERFKKRSVRNKAAKKKPEFVEVPIVEQSSEPEEISVEAENPWIQQVQPNSETIEAPSFLIQNDVQTTTHTPVRVPIEMPAKQESQQFEVFPPVVTDAKIELVTEEKASVLVADKKPIFTAKPVIIPNPPVEEQQPPADETKTFKPAIDLSESYDKITQPRETKKATVNKNHETENQYALPGAEFLSLPADGERVHQSPAEIESRAALLVSTLADFGVECVVDDYTAGPVLTRYELIPGVGVKVNRILNLSNDLTRALKAKRIRILAPIPGTGAVGIEVPNKNPETVYLREIMSGFKKEIIPVALGKTLEGHTCIVDLTTMPHLLIAGATGSGKSVCVHAIISTILLTRTPYQVKLAMIDPKMLELSAYKGIPHLWAPVVVQTAKAQFLLNALVKEMEERYALLARTGVRSISEYNQRFDAKDVEEHLPYIVVVIDELADLMMVAAREVETPIARLAQMARAVGIHLVVATQRPSVDVITGMIKANFPSRIAFNVGSKVDSRTIIDMNGAEKLLGKGDMLYIPAAAPEPVRVHGSFISTSETRALVEFWKDQPEMPFEFEPPDDAAGNLYDPGKLDFDDPILEEVKRVIIDQQRASVSMVQRKFRVGYARAGKLIDMLEQLGVVGPHSGSRPRTVLVKKNENEGENTDNAEI